MKKVEVGRVMNTEVGRVREVEVGMVGEVVVDRVWGDWWEGRGIYQR